MARPARRGAQWRLDYTDRDAEWGKKNLIAVKDGDNVTVTTRPLEPMPPELAQLFEAK